MSFCLVFLGVALVFLARNTFYLGFYYIPDGGFLFFLAKLSVLYLFGQDLCI